MSDVYFSTNPSDYAELEGLYIAEKNPPGFIAGLDLSTVGIGGLTVRGPTTPQLITSTARFLEIYGGRDYGSGGALVNEIWAALLNKPFGRMYVRRVTNASAVAGDVDLPDIVPTDIINVAASSTGVWSLAANNGPTVEVEDASDGIATHFNLRVNYLGDTTLYENLNVNGTGDDNLAEVIGDDPANLIVATKLANGRPINTVSAAPLTGGSDGVLASADYLAALNELAVLDGPSIVTIAGASVDQAALNGAIVTQAAAVHDRVFVTWSGVHGQTVAVESGTTFPAHITTRSDRIIWCFNSPYTLDPETGLKIQRGPHELMASILSQNDVDIHPGGQTTVPQTAGVSSVTNEALTRADLVLLRETGICTLEKLSGQFLFRSGVTTSLVSGKTEITRRRMADFLQLSAADRLKYYVKSKNTLEVRAQITGELVAFSQSLRDQSRVVEEFEVTQEGVNTELQRSQGIEKVLWRVKLIGHILALVIETEIGTGVIIESEAA